MCVDTECDAVRNTRREILRMGSARGRQRDQGGKARSGRLNGHFVNSVPERAAWRLAATYRRRVTVLRHM